MLEIADSIKPGEKAERWTYQARAIHISVRGRTVV